MLERDMSETPPPPGAARVEAGRTPETREAPDYRTNVVNALNRTLDRAQKKRDEIVTRVTSTGDGRVDNDEVEVVLGYQYAAGAVEKLTDGRDRLDYEVERDTFKVPVQDRETRQWYERDEGVPIGYLERFLTREYYRLAGERYDLRMTGREEEADALDREATEVFNDRSTLQLSSRNTGFSFYRDYYAEGVPHDLLYHHPSSPDSLLPLGVLQSNREETEAWLRSQNSELARLRSESPEQNMAEAMRDIGDVRRELEIPQKGIPDPMDKYRIGVFPTASVATADLTAGKSVEVEEEKGKAPEVPEEVAAENSTPGTSMAVRESETEESAGERAIPVYPISWHPGPKRRSEDRSEAESGTPIAVSEEDSRSFAEGSRGRFGILYDRVMDTDVTGEGHKVKDIIDDVKYKVIGATKFGGGLKDRIKKWIAGPPMSPSRRNFLKGIVTVGAAVVVEETIRRNLPDLGMGQGVGVGEGSGTSGSLTPGPDRNRVGDVPEVALGTPTATPPPEALKPPVPPETVRIQGPYKTVEVDIPGKGKEKLQVRMLTGDEPEIFNVPPRSITPETNQPVPVAISGAEVKRAIENPNADDETARMIRSYLDDDTIRLVNSLPESRYLFLTKGPQGEAIKEGFGSFRGLNDARVTETEIQKPFNMRSPEDLSKLKELKGTPEYEKAWRVIVADRLLRSGQGYPPYNNADNPGVVGFLSNGREITDIIVTAPNNGPYLTRDVSSLIRNRARP